MYNDYAPAYFARPLFLERIDDNYALAYFSGDVDDMEREEPHDTSGHLDEMSEVPLSELNNILP